MIKAQHRHFLTAGRQLAIKTNYDQVNMYLKKLNLIKKCAGFITFPVAKSTNLFLCLKGLWSIAFLLFVNYQGYSQDIHFSQYYTTPLLTNPANAGLSDNDVQLCTNYRSQWAKIGAPYKTLYTSLDGGAKIFGKQIGIGGSVIHDQSSFNLTSNEFLLALSYSWFYHNQQISIGIEPGFVTKSYDQSALTFGSQFDLVNQQFNPNLPSLENGLAGSLHYVDLNTGIYWRTLIHNVMPSAGISIRHLLRPVQSFTSSSAGTTLPMKLTLHSQVIIPLFQKFDLTPGLLYGYTPGAHELVAGTTESFKITELSLPVRQVYAVTMFRVNPLRNIDALIFGGGVRFNHLDVAMTYDSNVSGLKTATNFNGAFELSMVFTGGNRNQKLRMEPCKIY